MKERPNLDVICIILASRTKRSGKYLNLLQVVHYIWEMFAINSWDSTLEF